LPTLRSVLACSLSLVVTVVAAACTEVTVAPGMQGATTSGSGGAGAQGGHGGAGGQSGAGGQGGAVPADHAWQMTAAGQVQNVSVAVDPAGNVIVAGDFQGALDLGGGPLTGSAFLLKLDRNGKHVWSRGFDNVFVIGGLAVDALGDVLLAGSLHGQTNLGGGTLPDAGGFVAKLDPDANVTYARAFGDLSTWDPCTVAVDAAGNTYVAGTFEGTVDFGGGPVDSMGTTDVFVASLDPAGQHRYSRRFGGDDYDTAGRIAVTPDGRVALTGTYQGTPDLGGGPLPASTGAPFPLSFLLQLDAAGDHVASAGNHCRQSVPARDAAGATTLACAFTGDLDLGAGTLSSGYFIHVAAARFDAAQALAWNAAFGDVGATVLGIGSAPAGGGAVLLAGYGTGGLDFGGGQVLGGDHQGGFVAWLDAAGHHVYSRGFGGDGDVTATSAAVTPDGDVVYAGTFTGTIDLVTGPASSAGASDLFVAKLVP
jgi:hypothetical protein